LKIAAVSKDDKHLSEIARLLRERNPSDEVDVVSGTLEKLAGISHLSVDPVLGSSQQSPGARVAVQQRVTSKIFVTFATDVTSTQRQVIKFEYQMSPRTSLNAVRDQNGGFSFETRFRKRW